MRLRSLAVVPCPPTERARFDAIFPAPLQDIEFIEDFIARDPNDAYDALFKQMWARLIPRKHIRGIDGILFYELQSKKPFYPNKRDADLDWVGRGFATDPANDQ